MLSKMLRAAAGNQTAAPTSDANFKQVALLLHGDGTNGTQNNTFLDSSTNNFTVTRTGTPTQGTYTPYSQAAGYWGNYFAGSANRFLVGTNTAFKFTGDFTVECWIYKTVTGNQYMAGYWTNSSATACSWTIGVSAGGFLTFSYGIGSSNPAINGTTQAIPLNAWTHVAVVRSGTTVTLYVNGVADATTGTVSGTLNTPTAALYMGCLDPTDGLYFIGYISNFRIVNGTAVYTSNFTPSTIPLTAITNTSLLTCQSSGFVDNSSNNFTLTPTGTPSVQPWSPYAPTSAYSTGTNGGSLYFPGASRLTFPNNAAFAFGTGDFTVEFWFYPTVAGAFYIFLTANNAASSGAFVITQQTGGVINLTKIITSSTTLINSTVLFNLNTWNYIAASRTSGQLYLFVNGQQGGTVADTSSYTGTNPNLGADNNTASPITGYISNFRILKGTGLYTAPFTPPTAPLTAISGTSLLLSGTNAGIYDNAIKSDSITVGAAQVNTSIVKYGTGSISFNGTTSYLNFPNDPYYALGTGNWTVEAWVYPNSVTALQSLIDTRSTATATTGLLVSITAAGFISVTVNNAILFTSSTGITISAWTHVAVVKNGTTITLYLNGTKPITGSGTSSTALTDQFLRLGASAGTAANFFNGYLDEVRITNGVARYTANFTPPTSAFPNQ